MRQILVVLFTFLFFLPTNSQNSFEEEFDLNIGLLNNQNGWSGNTSFQVVSDDMSLPGYFFNNNEEKAVNIQTTGGTTTSISKSSDPLSAGAAYLSFLVRIDDTGNLRSSADYQVGVRKTDLTNSFVGVGFYRARGDNDDEVIRAALQTTTINDGVVSTETFSENTVYHVVLKYQFDLNFGSR